MPSRPSPIYDTLPQNTTNVLLELPLVRPDIAIEPLYMYFSTFHWSTLVNGYSGFSPPSYERLHNSLEHFPDSTALAELRRRDVTHIVIHGALYGRPGDYDAMVASLDESLGDRTRRHCRVAATPDAPLSPAATRHVTRRVGRRLAVSAL